MYRDYYLCLLLLLIVISFPSCLIDWKIASNVFDVIEIFEIKINYFKLNLLNNKRKETIPSIKSIKKILLFLLILLIFALVTLTQT